MPKRVVIPPQLARAPFSVSAARSVGLGEGRLRGADLERPFHGIRSLTALESTALSACRAFEPLLRPGLFFSHLTAAQLWGCPLPHSATRGSAIHVTATAPTRAPEGRGVVGHQSQLCVVVRRFGLPIADPALTFCQLASLIRLDDVVAVGDHLVLDPARLDPHDIRPHIQLDDLRERVRRFTGRGARAAASAIALVRQGAESRPETLLRLLLDRAGFPEPELNPEVRDASGRWLGRADLVYRKSRVIVEYDGEQHRTDSRQYEGDFARTERFVEAGWIMLKVRKAGLFTHPSATVARVEHALTQRGWRP